MNFKLNKMSRSKQNQTGKSQINGLPGASSDILNPSMKEILKLEKNDYGEEDLLEIYKLESNIDEDDDPNLDKKLKNVQRLSIKKRLEK